MNQLLFSNQASSKKSRICDKRSRLSLSLEQLEPRQMLSVAQGVYITEFMADNDNTLVDSDGDTPDWLEIYNSTAESVDLTGWHLTNDENVLDRWEFPSTQLDSGAYLVVYASGKDKVTATGEIHTNFNISRGGGYLALVESDATTVAHAFDFPAQAEDTSFGLPMSDFDPSEDGAGGTTPSSSATQIAVTDIQILRESPIGEGLLNNRGDEASAIDGDLNSFSYLTPSSTIGTNIVAFDLATLQTTNRLRISKLGNTDGRDDGVPGGIDNMDLQIFYTTDTGPLNARTYQPVANLTDGFDDGISVSEQIFADSVNSADATVDNDSHDFAINGEWFSLTFDSIQATGIAIQIERDVADPVAFVHYPIREAQIWDTNTTQHAINDIEVFFPTTPEPFSLNNRGDQNSAIDGDVNTMAFLTPSGSIGPQLATLDLGSLHQVQRLRVAKRGDIDEVGGAPGLGPIDNMDLQVLFTTDTGPMEDRTYQPVSGLSSGFNGAELINADSINPVDATVDNEHHDFSADGWYSLTFDTINATAIAVRFVRDEADSATFSHYAVFEIEVHEPENLIVTGNVPVTGIDQFPAVGSNDVDSGDSNLAIDGSLTTSSPLTTTGTDRTDGPQRVAIDLGLIATDVNRIRIYKQGDVDGDSTGDIEDIDPVDLTILYTTDTGPLDQRTYLPVSQLTNGYNDDEKINATFVDFNVGTVLEDRHDSPLENFYSLTFATVNITGLAVEFFPSSADGNGLNQYPIHEIQALFNSDAILTPQPEVGFDGSISDTSVRTFEQPTPGAINRSGQQGPRIDGQADSVVVFNEIMYHPSDDNQGLEWIELYNQMAVDIDLSGWSIQGGVYFEFPRGTVIGGGEYLVVAADPTVLQTTTGFAAALGPLTGNLSNGGQQLALRDINGRIMESIQYDDKLPWSIGADGSGTSLAKITPNSTSGAAENWTSSTQVFGTPGIENFAGGVVAPTLEFNEVAAATDAPFWVEISNDSDVAIDLDGYRLASNVSPGADYIFPTVTLQPGDLHLVNEAELGFHPLDNDRMFLFTPDQTTLVDASLVTNSLRGRSAAHGNQWLWPTSATPGTENTFDIEDSIVINEIMFHHRPDPSTPNVPAQFDVTTIVSFDDIWKYNQTGNDLGSTWFNTNHTVDDINWFNGAGILGVDSGVGILNNRGDEDNAIDGNLNTISFLTPSGTTGPNIVAFDLGSLETISRLRVAKQGDIDGVGATVDSMDLQILFTTDTGPLNERSYSPVLNLTNGFNSSELIQAVSIDPATATVNNDTHNLLTNGFYSLSFDAIPATGLAIQFARDAGDPENFTHYPIRTIDIQDGASPALNITDIEVFQPPISANLPASINTNLTLGPMTFYFQKEFTVTEDPTQFDSLGLNHTIDDGAIFYLNGVEISRFNMPEGPVDFQTPSTDSIKDTTVQTIILPTVEMVQGANILSVEVHQRAAGGSPSDDVLMGLELTLLDQTAPGIPGQPFTEINEEWIELYNKGTESVDLSNWQFDDAVNFVFPAGTSLAAGEYLVIANDAVTLQAKYPAINIAGSFSGKLSNRNERIVLSDANKNPADEVHYYDDNPWASFADGGGSSLELRDPDADNSKAESWAASDEGSKSTWQTITYRGIAASDTAPALWNEFLFGMLDAGEILLDDISVIEDPDGAAQQLIQNGSFESDIVDSAADKWRVIGNHQASVVVDPTDAGNQALHLIATGVTKDAHNHATTTLLNNTPIVIGQEYEISFRAKWLGGSNQLNSRLFFNKVSQTTLLEMPELHGTPGIKNSVLGADTESTVNIGPSFSNFQHSTAVPDPGQSVIVSTNIEDPDGVLQASLFYSIDGGAWQSTAMSNSSDSQFTATIPGQTASSIVQFYVEAIDGVGIFSTYPAEGQDSRALYQVNDSQAGTGEAHNFRIIMTTADSSFMRDGINLMSNQRLGATVIYNESEVFYDVGIRLKGSPFGRPNNESVSYIITFPADHLFRGIHDNVGVDRSGLGQIGRGGQDEILTKHITTQAGDIPGMYDDVIRVIGPQSSLTGGAILIMSRYRDVYLDSQFENGSDGNVFNLDVPQIFSQTTDGDPESPKVSGPSFIRTDIQDLGTNKEDYRWNLWLKNNRSSDDFSAIIPFAQSWSLTGTELDEATQATMDVDQWLRTFAMINLVGATDVYGQGSPHNLKLYVRPEDNKVIALPWDLDGNFNLSTTAPLWSQQASWNNFRQIIELPANTRLFYGHLFDIINRSFNGEYMEDWTIHYGDLAQENYAGLLGYINSRSSFVLSQLPPQIDFEISTGGGSPISVDDISVTVEGTGWFDIREVYLADNPNPLQVTWTDSEHWSVTVPLQPGQNDLQLRAFDSHDNLVGSAVIDVTSTVADRPINQFLRVSEINYNLPGSDEAEFIELINTSAVETLDLTGVEFVFVNSEGIGYTFGNVQLLPGQRIVVVKDQAAFATMYPTVPASAIAVGEFSGSLSNGGETLTLLADNGTVIQSFSYDDDWYQQTDGGGRTLVIVDPTVELIDYSSKSAWAPSGEVGGVPAGQASLWGDFNGDRSIGLTDLLILKKHFGDSSTTHAEGDLSGDQIVNSADLMLLLQSYGQTYGITIPSSAPPAAAAAALIVQVDTNQSQDESTESRIVSPNRQVVVVDRALNKLYNESVLESPGVELQNELIPLQKVSKQRYHTAIDQVYESNHLVSQTQKRLDKIHRAHRGHRKARLQTKIIAEL